MQQRIKISIENLQRSEKLVGKFLRLDISKRKVNGDKKYETRADEFISQKNDDPSIVRNVNFSSKQVKPSLCDYREARVIRYFRVRALADGLFQEEVGEKIT